MWHVRRVWSDIYVYRTVYALAFSGIILFNLSLAQTLAFGKILFPFYINVFYSVLAGMWTLFTLFRSTTVDHVGWRRFSDDVFSSGATGYRVQRLNFLMKRWLGIDGIVFVMLFVLSATSAQSLWFAFLFWGGWVIWHDLFGLKGDEPLDWLKLSIMGGAVSGVLLLFFLIPPLKMSWLIAFGVYAFCLLAVVLAGSALVDASLEAAQNHSDRTFWMHLGMFLKRNVLFIGPWVFLSGLMVAFSFFVYWIFLYGLWPLVSQGITAVLSWVIGEHRFFDFGSQAPSINENEPVLLGDEGNDPLSLPSHESLWLKTVLNIMRYVPEALLVLAVFVFIAYVIYKRKVQGTSLVEQSLPETRGLYVDRRPDPFLTKKGEGFSGRLKRFIKGRARTPLYDPLREEMRHMLDDLRLLQTWYPSLTVRELAQRGILSDDTATLYEAVRYGYKMPESERLKLAIEDIRRARQRLKEKDEAGETKAAGLRL
ncbi:MAG: hypothetical protein RBR24_08860 [Candidatus Carbobacillus sp.]|nr:hypothetical protein [Candidatus Carbobacillus sp.]